MEKIRENTGTFSGNDGLNIFYRTWPAEPERARLVIAHGLGEHSGRYGNVVERLAPLGVSMWAPDHRGHGQSPGKRGHITAFEQYVLDLKILLDTASQDRPTGSKVFLLGHSMGGLIALCFAERFPEAIDGLVVSSPALGLVVDVPAVKNVLGRAMSSIWPGLSMSNGLDATRISHDAEVVDAYQKDPLVHDRVTARWFTEFMGAMETINQRASAVQMPTLMQIAGEDALVNAQSSQAFFQHLGAEDKTLHLYDDFFHESYNETSSRKEQALSDLAAWIEARV